MFVALGNLRAARLSPSTIRGQNSSAKVNEKGQEVSSGVIQYSILYAELIKMRLSFRDLCRCCDTPFRRPLWEEDLFPWRPGVLLKVTLSSQPLTEDSLR